MTQPRILIACIGNIFLGDDAFGVEVARAMSGRKLPEEVSLTDFGIRGFDLAFALMDSYDVTIFVDATPRGGKPGTIYVIEPDLSVFDSPNGYSETAMVDAHSMNPMRVLSLAKSMGAEFKRILLVGCEPETLGPEEGQMGLSDPVRAAVGEAVKVIESLVVKILDGHCSKAMP